MTTTTELGLGVSAIGAAAIAGVLTWGTAPAPPPAADEFGIAASSIGDVPITGKRTISIIPPSPPPTLAQVCVALTVATANVRLTVATANTLIVEKNPC